MRSSSSGRQWKKQALQEAEHILIEYEELITRAAYRSAAEDVEKPRAAGWKKEQITEAI